MHVHYIHIPRSPFTTNISRPVTTPIQPLSPLTPIYQPNHPYLVVSYDHLLRSHILKLVMFVKPNPPTFLQLSRKSFTLVFHAHSSMFVCNAHPFIIFAHLHPSSTTSLLRPPITLIFHIRHTRAHLLSRQSIKIVSLSHPLHYNINIWF